MQDKYMKKYEERMSEFGKLSEDERRKFLSDKINTLYSKDIGTYYKRSNENPRECSKEEKERHERIIVRAIEEFVNGKY